MPPHRVLPAALALGLGLVTAAPLAAQADSVNAPHVMAAVVINAPRGPERRASAVENTRLHREIARFDARIVALELHLDSLKTHVESLDRDRAYFEAATAQARMRRAQIEQRLREIEARTASPADSVITTP
jgi:septal ring factor EnvC (AmiA/AmiB activator)